MNETESVAPREVVDLIYRASRVRGCNSSIADRVSTQVAFCEVHHGGGIAAWMFLVDDSRQGLLESARSSYRIDVAAAAACSERTGTADWEPPIPFALIAESICSYGQRGLGWSGCPTEPSGTDPVASIKISLEDVPDGLADRLGERSQAVLAQGLVVDRVLWSRLESEAAGFLMSEATLDAALDNSQHRATDE